MPERFSAESAETERRVVVAGIIVRDGKILVIDNLKHGLRTEPPGGKLEQQEEMEDAVVRELQEELGVVVRVLQKIGAYETDPIPEGTFDVHTFCCEIVEGDPMEGLEPGKMGAIRWLTLDELRSLPTLVPSMRSALDDIECLLYEKRPHRTCGRLGKS